MRKARAIAIVYTPRLNRIAIVLAFITVCSLLLYGVFLLEAVGATAKRADAGREMKHLTADLSSMQSRYLAYTKAVSPERAADLGFVKPTEISTVYASDSNALTFNSQ